MLEVDASGTCIIFRILVGTDDTAYHGLIRNGLHRYERPPKAWSCYGII